MALRPARRFPIHVGYCRCGKQRGHTDPCYGQEVVTQQTMEREIIMDQQQEQRVEALGPAERVINTLTSFTDHIIHNRPGAVFSDGRTKTGVRWVPVIWKEEDGDKVVYQSKRVGKRTVRERIGVMNGDFKISDGTKIVGEYRKPGIFPEVATYFYRQVADVWKMDNAFSAHWASFAFGREHRDLKVVLAAFMLVQSRMGDAVEEDGEILFYDDDFRSVGEAMCLIRAKDDINPKLLLRIGDVLNLPAVIEINRELGFGSTGRNPIRGRYYKVVKKWLRYREENLPMLKGLVKAGFKSTVQRLAERVSYKPASPKFFEVLRWNQAQAKDGRRTIALGVRHKGETWEGMSEKQICKLITKDKPGWKRIAGLLPSDVGMTRAIVAAAVEAGSMSNQDLIIMTPTLEELGLLNVKSVKDRWRAALEKAENQRATNIAKNVKSKEAKEGLQEATDKATAKALEEVTKDLRVYVIVDKSASMGVALERAQGYLTRFLGGFPLERLHVSVFNTDGREINIQAPKAAAVQQAFRGHAAGGGTSYAKGVEALAHHKPQDGEDSLILFVGDEEDTKVRLLVNTIERSGINPVAFGLLKVFGNTRCSHGHGTIVRLAAEQMGIPCFPVDENMFTSDDPYAVTRLLRDLIGSTPVGEQAVGRPAPVRKTLVQQILETPLLQKPLFSYTR
jgi:hypothetical protein